MGQEFYNKFSKCVSQPRSWDHATTTKHQTNHEITSSYQFNIMLCEALYPSLNLMEVSLRNAIHDSFKVRFANDRWFEDERLIEDEESRRVSEAKAALVTRAKLETTDRIIAELSLGFWVALFKRAYDGKFWRDKDAFSSIFPRMSKPERFRKVAFEKLTMVKNLRNSVFHHDNVLKDPKLASKYEAIYRVLHWIEPELAKYSKNFDRYPGVVKSGLAQAQSCQMDVFYKPNCISKPEYGD